MNSDTGYKVMVRKMRNLVCKADRILNGPNAGNDQTAERPGTSAAAAPSPAPATSMMPDCSDEETLYYAMVINEEIAGLAKDIAYQDWQNCLNS